MADQQFDSSKKRGIWLIGKLSQQSTVENILPNDRCYKIPEDRKFLLAQSEKGRRGCLDPVDKVLTAKEARCKRRVLQTKARKEKEIERMQQLDTDNDYIIGQRKIKSLKVVNDAAERGVALIQEFNRVVTNDKDQKQYLMQVIEEHRKDFPISKKCTIIAARRK
ncbi:hypothetical protein HELRODRAFT_174252 [Helobdella robusta]|uniref:Uncharacterized protein n=1 Tax=Helobdella robusta TaxID=6412 RepID=T1F7W1_HELRO|nr:hypothetical protein HELRODRAFT_174252 [Helobdella robusta]ESO02828.1 hypothetical protein HELRODRAFT_174252 [Helobdella robusta]